jgi:hypothetical protein
MTGTSVKMTPPNLSPEFMAFAEQVVKEIKSVIVEKPLTKKEAADYLNMSYRTFERRISGPLKTLPDDIIHKDPVSGQLYFFPSELNEYLKSL